ncbi:MAG: ABC transporter ATP-binding protein [Kiritimatiellaeota bacterium]|nr:ABC transporter ATP-binding protein [Kiritimatiellota bacterium]
MNYSRFIALLKPYKLFIAASAVTLAIFSMLGLFLPMVLKVIIDDVLPNRDSELLLALLLGLALVYIVRSLFFYISHYFTFYTCQRVLFDIRRRLIVHIHSLPIKFYDNTRVGTLITRIINDVGKIQGMVNQGLNQLITQSFSMILILLIMFCIDWQLTLICLIPLPLFTLNFWRTKRFQLVEQKRLSERISEISGNLSEVLNGARVVKSFDSGKKENRKFVAEFRRVFDITLGIQLKSVVCGIINEILVILAVLLLMGAGAYKVWEGLITIGDFISFYSYLWMLFLPIQILTNLSNVLGEGMAGMTRIQQILDSPAEVPDGNRSLPENSDGGEITFEKVAFSYGGDKVLSDFNLTVNPGDLVALVGPSGSGKSTLATLLLRFYDVGEGAIKVNGVDIRQVKRKEYREKVNAVLQEPYLFSGTIHDNIAYGNQGATRREIEEAAKQANAHEFIMGLANGYESVVGEHGIGLSGGQKQRIAIARTLLRDPMVLVLDEATSALDNQSELEVQKALSNLSGTRTIIVIAHRLSTIRDADVIVVMNNGRIAEMGDHSQLIKNRGLYYELYKKSDESKPSEKRMEMERKLELIPMPTRNDFEIITPAI